MDLKTVIRKVLQGQKEEFRLIITECNQPLYRTALAILKTSADAEDVVQSTYLKAYTHLHTFRGESSFMTWITRILINECRMFLRKRKQTLSLDHDDVKTKPSLTEDVVEHLYKNQLTGLLEDAVMELPEKYRLVYVVREVNEFSTRKTADVLGITEENVKVRLHRARTLIRENLLQHVQAKELFPFGDHHCEALTERVMNLIRAIPAEAM